MIIFQQAKKSENYDAWVVHSYEVLNIANQIDNNAYNIESAYRGFLLTGGRQFLSPVEEINRFVLQDLDVLEDLTTDSPEQAENLLNIRKSYSEFYGLQEKYRAIYEHFGARAIMTSDITLGQNMMNKFQEELNEFMSVELHNLNQRVTSEKEENASHTRTIIICAVISIVELIAANILILVLLSTATKTKLRLKNIEELYGLVLENMSDGLFDYDPKTKRMTYSLSYKRQLGYEGHETLPDHIDEIQDQLVHPADKDRVRVELENYLNKEIPSYSIAFRMKRKNGTWIWVLSRAMATWNDKGEMIRLFGVHTDITEQKQHEQELRELNSELEDFTYIASHDLRSPLVNIKGFTKEVESSVERIRDIYDKGIDEATKDKDFRYIVEKDIPESLNFINSAVERMDTLTNAILNLSRIGRRVYKPVNVNVNDTVTRCLNALKYEITAANAVVKVDDLPGIVADSLATEQIFSNLIENAVKYLDPSRPGEIEITAVKLEKKVVYSIKDNGRGIGEKEGDKIFSIFRRANNSGNIRGTGMGLAFVKATIRKMRGDIWYESVPGHGTIFYVSLPDTVIEEENASAAA